MKICFLYAGILLASVSAHAELFEYNGKKYNRSDLPQASQAKFYETQFKSYQMQVSAIDNAILEIHFADLAKKKKKPVEEVEADALSVANPSEKQIRAFYNKNKSRIPPNYTYEKVKPQLVNVLKGELQAEKRNKLLSKLKKRFKLKLKKPTPVKINLDVAGFATKGKKGAKVRVVEFADYQCPHCKHAFDEMKKVMKKNSSKVEFVFVDFPINRSGISKVVAEGSYCAKEQGKYWEYHEMAFEGQAGLKKDSPLAFAKKLKLNTKKFSTCLKSAAAKSYVSKGKSLGESVGVNGTPAIFINGEKFYGSHDNLSSELKAYF